MNDVDALIAANQVQLALEYSNHSDTAKAFLVDLGTTETARINEQFDATLSVQVQGLADRGFYASPIETDITARNTRDRNEELAAHNDRLMREKLANEHQLYGQQVTLAEYREREIVSKMNEYAQRLSGLQSQPRRVHEADGIPAG